MARLINQCIFATFLIILFFTFASFIKDSSTSTSTSGIETYTQDESLQGAVEQEAAKAAPPTYTPHDPPMKQAPQPEKEEPKKEEPKKGGPKKGEKKPEPKKDEKGKPDPVPPPEQKTFDVPGDIVYNKEGPKPEQIVLLAASDGKGHNGGIPDLLVKAKENRQEYADYKGYKFHFIDISKYDLKGAHPVWAKIPAIIETFNTYPEAQWVWWLDLDAIIMEPSIDLNAHLLSHSAMYDRLEKGKEIIRGGGSKTGLFTAKEPDVKKIDIIVSQDHNGLNAGSFFIRRSWISKIIVDVWVDPLYVAKDWPGKEQDALLNMVINHRFVRESVGYVNQRVINAYPVGGDNMGWFKGDLTVHLAGCWVENACKTRFDDFWGRRTTVAGLKAGSEKKE